MKSSNSFVVFYLYCLSSAFAAESVSPEPQFSMPNNEWVLEWVKAAKVLPPVPPPESPAIESKAENNLSEKQRYIRENTKDIGTFGDDGIFTKSGDVEIFEAKTYDECMELVRINNRVMDEGVLLPIERDVIDPYRVICGFYEEGIQNDGDSFGYKVYLAKINGVTVGGIATYYYSPFYGMRDMSYSGWNETRGGKCILRFQGIQKTPYYLSCNDKSQKAPFHKQILEHLETEAMRMNCGAMGVLKPVGPMIRKFQTDRSFMLYKGRNPSRHTVRGESNSTWNEFESPGFWPGGYNYGMPKAHYIKYLPVGDHSALDVQRYDQDFISTIDRIKNQQNRARIKRKNMRMGMPTRRGGGVW